MSDTTTYHYNTKALAPVTSDIYTTVGIKSDGLNILYKGKTTWNTLLPTAAPRNTVLVTEAGELNNVVVTGASNTDDVKMRLTTEARSTAVPTIGKDVLVIDSTFDSEDDTASRELYLVIHQMMKYLYTEGQTDAMAPVVADIEHVLWYLDNILIPENEKLIAEQDIAADSAMQSPVGKLLGKHKEVKQFLDYDISTLDQMYYYFRIMNVAGYNTMEDTDEATDRTDVYRMFTEHLRDWYKYFHPMVKRQSIDHSVVYAKDADGELIQGNDGWEVVTPEYTEYYYRVIGYYPAWDKIRRLPNHKFTKVLQLCARVECGVPKKKTSTWVKIRQTVVTVIVVVVVTWLSGGTLTSTAMMLMYASAAASIAAAVTGSETWAKVAKVLAVVSAVYGMTNGFTSLGVTTAQAVQYALQAVSMYMDKSAQDKIKDINKDTAGLQEETDNINEEITSIDSFPKILNWIYSDHHDNRFSHNYDTQFMFKYS